MILILFIKFAKTVARGGSFCWPRPKSKDTIFIIAIHLDQDIYCSYYLFQVFGRLFFWEFMILILSIKFAKTVARGFDLLTKTKNMIISPFILIKIFIVHIIFFQVFERLFLILSIKFAKTIARGFVLLTKNKDSI